MSARVQVTTYVDAKTAERLQALADAEQRTMAALLRLAITRLLNEEEAENR